MCFGGEIHRQNVTFREKKIKIKKHKKYSVFLEDLDSLVHDLAVVILLGVQLTHDRDELGQTCLVQKFTIQHQFSSKFNVSSELLSCENLV